MGSYKHHHNILITYYCHSASTGFHWAITMVQGMNMLARQLF